MRRPLITLFSVYTVKIDLLNIFPVAGDIINPFEVADIVVNQTDPELKHDSGVAQRIAQMGKHIENDMNPAC